MAGAFDQTSAAAPMLVVPLGHVSARMLLASLWPSPAPLI
jgi:hypothetical protein